MPDITEERLDEREDRLLRHIDAKLSAIKGWGVAALLGGQAVAGLLSAVVVKTGQADAPVQAARVIARTLF